MTDLEALKKDFADLDWTAAKAENARLRERERALIDELAEARRDAKASLSQRADLVEELAEARREIGERVLERTALLEKVKRAEEMRQAFDTESQVVFSRARKAEDALANARSAAIEECREKAKQMGEWGFADVLTRLPPPPPSGRFVADEVMERVENELRSAKCSDVDANCDKLYACAKRMNAGIHAALAALNAEKQR